MSYKRILTIQDISCVGQCSLTVALPILSACGHETCIIPSAVLSTHTYNFKNFTFRDLTDDIPAIQQHWQSENISFDAVYTGYLGSTKQIGYVKDIINSMISDGGMAIVDPAMGDHGKLYPGFDAEYAAAMAELCAEADVILPNITEACMMCGYEYKETYDEAYVNGLLEKLSQICKNTIVLTGVSYKADETGVLVWKEGKTEYYRNTDGYNAILYNVSKSTLKHKALSFNR